MGSAKFILTIIREIRKKKQTTMSVICFMVETIGIDTLSLCETVPSCCRSSLR